MKIQGVFPGQRVPDGPSGEVAVTMLNTGVAAVERAYCITRARTPAEAREIAMDLVAILAECMGVIAGHDFDRWPVGEDGE